ncbi:putative PIG3 family NAD(P)H quinone oxidoreductase [Dyadobacter jejuensis]|uniref:Putative PIG3 family NAD(P)H quinone oxidoreductase n=1 Tax=Dyadobacter jejuensis TaxID=1082580 RepID=A0A316APL5_9BACT|nr:NAD(P)H-quinone oxidoreductase [Dyadobacter jejuensis]PWJ59532.1 putative PIG3 family NAD(P)H quinone oxidoreductase [Dyadobacter jejuensis]
MEASKRVDDSFTMQVMAISGEGNSSSFTLLSRPLPTPGPGQVLIRVAAAGVNRPDVYQRKGHYPPPSWAPADVPGLEVAGVITSTGEGVAADRMGDKVCALVSGGGYASHVLAEAIHCLPIPEGWSFVEAATLPETVFTVWHNVFQRGRLKSGERLLVHGGSSGIGITAIQLAKALGARVYATAGSASKCAACESLGAERCIDYRQEDFEKILASEGVDLILDMVGGDYVPKNLRILHEEGRLVLINTMKGSKVEVDFGLVMRKRLHISGSTLRGRSHAFKSNLAKEIYERVWPIILSGEFRPVIYKTFPLQQALQAHDLLESSTHIGKVVLQVAAI